MWYVLPQTLAKFFDHAEFSIIKEINKPKHNKWEILPSAAAKISYDVKFRYINQRQQTDRKTQTVSEESILTETSQTKHLVIEFPPSPYYILFLQAIQIYTLYIYVIGIYVAYNIYVIYLYICCIYILYIC